MFDKLRQEIKTIILIGKSDKSIYKVAYYVFLGQTIMALIAFLVVLLLVKRLFDNDIGWADFSLAYVLTTYLVVENTAKKTLKEFMNKKSPT